VKPTQSTLGIPFLESAWLARVLLLGDAVAGGRATLLQAFQRWYPQPFAGVTWPTTRSLLQPSNLEAQPGG
jgi:hypothetical protein